MGQESAVTTVFQANNAKHILQKKNPQNQRKVFVFCFFLSGVSKVKPLDGVKILDLTRFVFCLIWNSLSI